MLNVDTGIVVPSFMGKSLRSAVEVAQQNGLEINALGSGIARQQSPSLDRRLGAEVVHRHVGSADGGHVRRQGAEAGRADAGAVGVFAGREREQLLVAIAIERIGRVVQTGLRECAHLVEKCDDVDGGDATGRRSSSRQRWRARRRDLPGGSARRLQ